MVDPIAADLVDSALDAVPALANPRFAPALLGWARAEAMAAVLAAYLHDQGLHDDQGRLRPAEQALHRAETRAASLRRELGLSPMSAARLALANRAARLDQPVFDLALELAGLGDEEQAEDGPGSPGSAP